MTQDLSGARDLNDLTFVGGPDEDRLSYQDGKLVLTCRLADPDPEDVRAVAIGAASFGLHAEDDLLVLCHQFESGALRGFSPYHYFLSPEKGRQIPADPKRLSSEFHVVLEVRLVDSEDETLVATREGRLSPEVSLAIHRTICKQAAHPFHPEYLNAAWSGFYQHFPSPDEAMNACRVRFVWEPREIPSA